MDTINFVKGYNQLKNLEDQAAAPSSYRRRKKLLAVSIIVFLTLIVVAVAAVAVVNYPYAQSPSLSHSNKADASIKAICNVTQYPASCFAGLSSALKGSPKFDLEHILVASLKISLARLSDLSSFPETLILRAEDPRSEGALRDCASLLEDASAQVNSTISSMAAAPGEERLTESKIQDMRTWLSSAITDQETCLDGLEEMDSKLVDEVKNAMQPSREFTSISLAIVSSMKVKV